MANPRFRNRPEIFKTFLTMQKLLCLLGLLVLTHGAADAQDTLSAPQAKRIRKSWIGSADTTYIQLFPNTYTVRTYLGEKFATFSVEDQERKHDLDYKPNAILALGVGVTYRGIGLNVSTRLPFHDTKEELYGRTRRYDVQVHRYRRKLAMDIYLQRYKGFHLNDKGMDPGYVGEGTTERPEYPYYAQMRSLKLGATALYVFNGSKFSMRSAVNQQEWQLKSSGSPMVGAAFYFQQLTNGDAGLIPDSYPSTDIFQGYNPTKVQSYGLTIHGGYGYTFVYRKHWFATLAADIGFGPGYIRMEGRELTNPTVAREEKSSIDFHGRANLRASLGYNSMDWTIGLYGIAHGDRYTMPIFEGDSREGQIGSTQGIIRLVAARRFPMKERKKKITTGETTIIN